jgi:hypothetical protein
VATLVGGTGGQPTLSGSPIPGPSAVNLSTSQTGNGQSTNVCDRGGSVGPALLRVSTVAGTTVTVSVEGSPDNVNWFNIPYSTQAAPTSVVVANVVITTTTVNYYYLQGNYPWRFVRLTLSANTGMTVSADCWVF